MTKTRKAKIEFIRSWRDGVGQEEAKKLAEEAGGRLATNREIDELLQSGKANPDDFIGSPWARATMPWENSCTIASMKIAIIQWKNDR